MFNVDEIEIKKKSTTSNVSIGIGGTLIMVIFVVLCLTIFATLSFTTAYSDLKLSKKTEEIITDYYATNKKAEEKLSEVYDKLISAQNELNINYDINISKTANFRATATEKLMELNDVTIVKNEENNSFSEFAIYYESLGDLNQKICVTLNIYFDEEKNEPYYEIVSWNLTNIELPSYEEEIYDLWEGIE